MFKKPTTPKAGRRTLRGSEVRALRESLVRTYAGFGRADGGDGALVVDRLLAKKAAVDVQRVTTHQDAAVSVYMIDGVPLFFEPADWQGGAPIPTVLALWRLPAGSLPSMTTWPQVVDRLVDGADLMLPGVVVPREGLGDFAAQQVRCVVAHGSQVPVAVGVTAVSSDAIKASGMTGRGLITLHTQGDHLCALGPKTKPPATLPDLIPAPDVAVAEQMAAVELDDEDAAADSHASSSADAGAPADADAPIDLSDAAPSPPLLPSAAEASPLPSSADDASEAPAEAAVSPAEMDDLLETALLFALRGVNDRDLPMPATAFYSAHLLPVHSPVGPVDVHRSSHKKLTKFLRAMEKAQLLRTKETAGNLIITSVNRAAPKYVQFVPPPRWRTVTRAAASAAAASAPRDTWAQITVAELFSAPDSFAPIFAAVGAQRSAAMTRVQARQVLDDYVGHASLVDAADPKFVVLDPHICVALKTSEQRLSRQALVEQYFARLSAAYSLQIGDERPVVRKGAPPAVQLDVARRGGNKMVTLVRGLHRFGFDLDAVAKDLQHRAASSAAVTTDRNEQVVLVQGDVAHKVADIIVAVLGVPKKLVNVAEGAKRAK